MHLWIEDFFSGFVGGCLCIVCGHPFDTMKVRQQTMSTSLLVAVKQTYQHEGIRGFYKGMMMPLIIEAPCGSLFYGVYGNALRYFQNNEEGDRIVRTAPSFYKHVYIAGCITGIIYSVVSCPAEVVKILMQVNTENKGHWKKHYISPYTNVASVFAGILETQGIAGLYKGFVPLLIREVPTAGLYTLTYEYCMASLKYNFGNASQEFISGGIAGVVSWFIVYPVDVVKSRIQSDDPKNPKYKGMIDCVKKIYKAEGTKGFTKGFFISNVAIFVFSGASFIGYEETLHLIKYLKHKFND